ncbi:RNA polymerase sigma factor [Streptosporangium sp. NPDC048865]|uniref:RNA polymerase sigma factor n=1 Tax=Streptosporangium sp. NPDC048865 TaxID=3155766 RepID=UPI003430F359
MPPTAVATSSEASTTLDQLLDRGRVQGHLSLAELRHAFAEAGISPTEGRSILRELTEAGVSLAAENEPALAASGAKSTRKAPARKTRAAAPARKGTAKTEAPAEAPDAATAGTGPAGAPKAAGTNGTAVKRTARTTRTAVKGAGKAADGAAKDAAEELDDEWNPQEEPEVEVEPTLDLDDQSSVMGDSVHTYLKSIGRRTLLTAAQEVELAKRIEAGLYAESKLEAEPGLSAVVRDDLEWIAEDGRRAKDHMLEANLRLVVSVAKKYTDRGMALLDVVQEGNLGLIRAVEKFDYTKGYKFSTYAMWWIRQAIQRGFADSARTIRLPVHVLEMLSKLSRVERDMHQRLGREPTPEELGVELDKTPDQIEELLRTSRQPISLNATIGEDGETTIGDLIEDVDSPEASEVVDRQLLGEQLRGVLGNLSPREAKIMALRFGLVDGKPHTLDEIGKCLGLTRERIRQLEKESLSKLRHPSNTRPLLDWAS